VGTFRFWRAIIPRRGHILSLLSSVPRPESR